MTEGPGPGDNIQDDTPAEPPRERRVHEAEPEMPRWVPTVIGLVLVILGALAVYTGVRYRNPTLANDIIHSRRVPRSTPAAGAPGEPEAGASLIFPGESGDNTPAAGAPVTGRARASITGGPQGVNVTPRLSARRGLMTVVQPDDAMIYVNDLAIGEASRFDTENEIYDFPAPGSYTIRIVAPGYREQQFVVTAAENARDEVVRLGVKLVKE